MLCRGSVRSCASVIWRIQDYMLLIEEGCEELANVGDETGTSLEKKEKDGGKLRAGFWRGYLLR